MFPAKFEGTKWESVVATDVLCDSKSSFSSYSSAFAWKLCMAHVLTALTSSHIQFSAAAKGAHIVFMMNAASTRSLQEQVWKDVAKLEIAGKRGCLNKLATAALGSQKSRQVLTKGALRHSGPLCSCLGQPSCDSRCFISQKSHLPEVTR